MSNRNERKSRLVKSRRRGRKFAENLSAKNRDEHAVKVNSLLDLIESVQKEG